MNKNIILCSFLVLWTSSCAIEEIPRQPLLTPPLGLVVKIAPGIGGSNGLGLFFTANNPEIYFTGYAIFVSTQKEDFNYFSSESTLFPIRPTDVPGNAAQILKNYNPNINDTNLTIWIGGAMSFPERRFYPPPPSELQLSPETSEVDPTFDLTSFITLPDDSPFVSGTTYYFVIYAYSSVDNVYSLPSNIAEITFP